MSAIAAFDVGATTTRVAIDHRGTRTLVDPDVLVVCGGVTETGGIRTQITEAVRQLRTTSETTASLIDIGRLEFLEPDERPGIEGAIHLALQIPEMSDRFIRSAEKQIEGETA
jgi:hypothetical protein